MHVLIQSTRLKLTILAYDLNMIKMSLIYITFKSNNKTCTI